MWATVLVMIMQLGTLILVAWATREFGTDHTFVVLLRHARGEESLCEVGSDVLDVFAAHEMEDCWPFGVALRGEASNHLKVR
ncbi:MAG TPA: hypothetical protein VGQ24_06415 [Gemmatimonadales bacterium]|nr:hypothetical protein [Gemmatimonadales bacterium]